MLLEKDTKTRISEYQPLWGTWKITSLLGSGASSLVFEAENDLGAYSALKVMTITLPDRIFIENPRDYLEERKENRLKEIRYLLQLRGCQGVVAYEDYACMEIKDEKTGELTGYDILIRMELLTPLSELIKEGKQFLPEEVRKIGLDVSGALANAYMQFKLVHRDIKPDNIFVNDRNEYKIGDFGVATYSDDLHLMATCTGTGYYMAPEVYKRKLKYGPSVDVYSLGIVLYQLSNGNRLPFVTEESSFSDFEKANELRAYGQTIPKLEYTEKDLADIIDKACQYQPGKRYKDITEMYQALSKKPMAEKKNLLHMLTDRLRMILEVVCIIVLICLIVQNTNLQKKIIENQEVMKQSEINQTAMKQAVNEAVKQVDEYRTKAEEAEKRQAEEAERRQAEEAERKLAEEKAEADEKQQNTLESDNKEATPPVVEKVVTKVLNQAEQVEEMLRAYLYQGGELDVGMLGEVTKLRIMGDAFISVECGDVIGTGIGGVFIMKTGFTVDNVPYDFGTIQNIDFIKYLSNCTYMQIEYNQIEDISPIKDLTQLTDISFSYNNISDISPISGLTRLKEIYFVGNKIEDITALAELSLLEFIGLWENKVKDLTPLSNLKRVNKIWMNENRITDIEPLKNMKSLVYIYMWDNQISDLTPISELYLLREIDLRDNLIEKTSMLGKLERLDRIDIGGNPLDKDDLRELKAALPDCSISH